MRVGIFVVPGPGSLESGADSAGTSVVWSRSALLISREGESLAQQSSKQVRRGLHAGLGGINEKGLQRKRETAMQGVRMQRAFYLRMSQLR